MNRIKGLGLALATAVGLFGAAAEAATPEEQIDAILNLPVTQGDDLEMRLREPGDFAVTDLDGNGRIELLFLQETQRGVPEEAEQTEIENVRSAWKHIASVPVSRKLYAYEISVNGKRLDPVSIVFTDNEIDPNLRHVKDAYRDAQRNITYYGASTLLRIGDAGYRVACQYVSLQNGALQIQTIASEFGNYGIYSEQGAPEAVFDHAEDRYGNNLSQAAFGSAASDYAAGCEERFRVHMQWYPVQELRESKLQENGMRTLLLDSWQGFSLTPQTP
ncbi:MAG: hypothetical protein IJ812_05545 [Schwartzia sp.]|nr:hypothetical protein [Schwartzia sp. (in: firmicutes)]